ncbi:AraC family transcriptional regulator [Gulosibacter chungangensis]|uniref:AraC family transcriptional regulator n=1 Tax=Gulosibacter chungangensis TaxID=979746 RepID=A0A7J5B817_9MICO|nr:AraC family transcriptional regulator [Gulosibacter chungangensis]
MPLRFLTEQHVSAHSRRLGRVVTVVLVERGAGVLTNQHGRHQVRSGDMVVFEPEAEFHYTPARPLRISMMTIDPELLLDAIGWLHARSSLAGRARVRAIAVALSRPVMVLHPAPGEAARIRRILHAAMRLQGEDGRSLDRNPFPRMMTLASQLMEVLDPLVVRDHPHRLFAEQLRAAATLELPVVQHPGVRRALEFVAARPPGAWTLQSLAEAALLSPGHFARVFAAEVGSSPRQFLSERRLTEFIVLIHTSTLTVSQAARRVGWASVSHAINAYRKHTGTTPAKARVGQAASIADAVIVPGERMIPPPSIELIQR